MQIDKKYFVSNDSLLDSDSADFSVSQNAWVNMENFRTGTPDIGGVTGAVESILGTELISSQEEEYIAIGSCPDDENQRFFTFYYSPIGNHKIDCCYSNTNTIYTVLKSEDVVGGLNFTKEPIHSSAIISNLLSWVDGYNNEPRKINVDSGIKAYDSNFETDAHPYSLPINFSEITLIKPTAPYSPNIQKKVDQSFVNNFIANQSFQFGYRFVYYDGEIAVIGGYSNASKLNYQTEKYNYISITMDSNQVIPDSVRLVQLIVRVQDGTVTGGDYATIIKTWNKEISSELAEINNQNAATSQLSFNFYNNITGEVIPTSDVLRPFDNVPIYSQTMEVAKYRQFLANNTEGYDTPKITSLGASLTNLIEPNNTTIPTLAYVAGTGFNQGNTQGESWWYNAILVQVPGYSQWYAIASTEQYSYGTIDPPIPIPPPSSVPLSGLVFKGNNFDEFYANVVPSGYAPANDFNSYVFPTNPGFYVSITDINATAYSAFPQLSSYKLGIVFYDYAMRKCGVVNKTSYSGFNTIGVFTHMTFQTTYPHTVTISNYAGTAVNVGDIIMIDDGSSVYEFTIESSTLNTNGDFDFSVLENVGNIPMTFASMTISRRASLDISTPARTWNPYMFGGIQWQLDNTNSLEEIPDWAYYYSVVSTLNLRTRFLVQAFSNSVCYATKNTNGEYVFNSSNYNYNPTAVAIGVQLDSLSFAGLGYVYSEGDVCILTRDDNEVFELPIIGQSGNYVIVKILNIGSTSNRSFMVELYTPYKTSTQEPYYETGEIYKVINPATSQRQYNTISGVLLADTFFISRSFQSNTYWANAMCPNDLYYKRWDTDASKPNFITDIGQSENTTAICWSDTITTGTRVNGTSTFRLGSRTFVSDECGAINKLILTSKVQDAGQGMVMLAVSVNETSSLYLGETQIIDNTGATQFFSGSSDVVGTINILKGSFGTTNPEAVVEFRGQVYYPDASKGVWVQYSSNGLFPISNYKTMRFWKSFFKQYLSMTKEQIEFFGGRPYIFTAVDGSHLELLISIPRLLEESPKGYLPDYQEIPYPFDMWDGQAKTIVFCLDNTNQQSHWQGAYSFSPELFTTIGNSLYGYKNGNLWQHNSSSSYNTFYGEYHPSRIMFVSNALPQSPKVYNNIKVHASKKPSLTYFYNDFPYLQITDLLEDDYRDFEGIYYASLYRNKMIPLGESHGVMQYSQEGLLTFEKMRNVAMKVMLEFSPSKSFVELKFAEIGYDISSNSPSQ